MKKILLFFILLMLPLSVYAKTTKYDVTLSKCVDGDTATVILKKEKIKIRFLAIDTPESVHPTKEVEAYGKDASEYTCNKLTNAKKIEIEYDSGSNKTDKYGRHLVWVFVDDKLFQKELISIGYAKVAYLYGDYKYTEELEKEQEQAKNKKIGIWSDYVETSEKNETKTKSKEKKDIIDILLDNIENFFEEIIDYVFNLVEDML